MERSGCSRCEEEKKEAAGEPAGCQELFSRQISYALRGGAILMVMASHYGEWYAASIGIPALSQFLMGLGRYGVDIFFLMSGYAMAKNAVVPNATVKEAAERKPGCAFWAKRLRGTYVPYLILAGIIEICAGGAVTPARVVRYLLAQDYWFIFNIMVFYLAFFAAFQARRFRIVSLTLFTAAFSAILCKMGRQDFWYVSNLAFPLGGACGLYEKRLSVWLKGKWIRVAAAVTLLCIILCRRQCGSGRCCCRRAEEGGCSWRQTPFFPSGLFCFPGLRGFPALWGAWQAVCFGFSGKIPCICICCIHFCIIRLPAG